MQSIKEEINDFAVWIRPFCSVLTEWKDKLQTGKKHLQIIFQTQKRKEKVHLEYVKILKMQQ